MMKKGKRIVSLIAVGVIMVPAIIDTPVFAKDNDKNNKTEEKLMQLVEERLNKEEILKDMNNLVIGDNARVAGFKGEEAAANYLKKNLKL